MATLAAINKTLERVDDNTETTSKGINSFVSYLKDNKRKELEAAREAKNAITKNAQADASNTTNNAGKKADGSGLLSGVRNILAGATLARLAPMLGKTLLKRVLGPAAIALFAEDIVEMLLPDGLDNPELKEALTGGLQGAALGFAIGGPLGAAIGGGVGALMTNDKFKKAVGDLGKTLKEQAIILYDKIEPAVIRFKNSFVDMFNALGITKEGVVAGLAGALTTIGNAAASGVESLTKLIKGDFEPMDLVKGITTLGAVAALLMPGKFVKFLGLLAGKKGLLGLLTKGAAALGMTSLLGTGKDTIDVDKTPKPGTVVKSSSGKLMLAGADGKATTTKAPPGSKIGDVISKTGGTANKFGRMMKFLRLPGISTLLAGYDIYGILNSDSSKGEKAKALTEVFGGVLGGIGGLKVGALVGGALGTMGFPLVGTGIGAIAGSAAGYFGGKALAGSIAEFLLGGEVKKPPMPKISSAGGSMPSVGSDSMRMGRGGPTQTFNKPAMTGNNNSQKLKNNMMVVDDLSGNKSGSTVIGGDSNITNNSSSTNVSSTSVVGRSGVLDAQDQFGFMPT